MRARAYPISLFFAACALCLALTAFPHFANAHGAGLTFTSTTTDYLVDVDYSAFGIIVGEPGRFDFKLFKDAERTKPVDFTQVWVRISKKTVEGDDAQFGTIFSGWIAKALFGTTGMSIALPESGQYEMLVRYNSGDDEIVETTLPFSVEAAQSKNSFVPSPAAMLGFAAGALVATAILFGYRTVIRRRR